MHSHIERVSGQLQDGHAWPCGGKGFDDRILKHFIVTIIDILLDVSIGQRNLFDWRLICSLIDNK